MKASEDPNSTKYPDRVFYSGRWRTPEQVEKTRGYQCKFREGNPEKRSESNRKYREENPEKAQERNRRRLFIGHMYLGMVGFTEKEREELLNGSSD